MSTQISPSILFIQSNPIIVPIYDRLSNAGGDKALPTTAQSTPQFKVYSRRCIVSDTLMPCHEATSEIMPESDLDNSSSPSHSSFPVDLVPSDLDLPIALRKGVRSRTIHPISNFVSYHRLSSSFSVFTSHLSSIEIPKNVQEAFGDPRWKATVVEKVKALEKNGTSELVTLPKGKRTMGCKWVFPLKYKSNGSVERYKARLVAKDLLRLMG